MEFNLIFFSTNNSRPDFQKVDAFLRTFTKLQEPTQNSKSRYQYFNKRTGVKGEFTFNHELLDKSSKKFHNFPGFFQSPFSFSVNLLRPTFFAFELMPFVTRLAYEFEFYIFDTQSEIIQKPAIQRNNQLIASWQMQNEKLIRNTLKEDKNNLLIWKREKAYHWWMFMYKLEDFRRNIQDDIFVP